MAYERPARRETNHGAQEYGKPNEVNNGPETPKPTDDTGINKEIPTTKSTDAPGQFGKW